MSSFTTLMILTIPPVIEPSADRSAKIEMRGRTLSDLSIGITVRVFHFTHFGTDLFLVVTYDLTIFFQSFSLFFFFVSFLAALTATLNPQLAPS